MKLPFEFGTKLIFRLVFPGVILAVAFFPAVQSLIAALGIAAQSEVVIAVEIIALGWLVVISDMRIYMLFEGRRYWPQWLHKRMIDSERRRLSDLGKAVFAEGKRDRKYLEKAVEYALFPVQDDGDAYVEHPTRLGNLLESFETYPKVKYGFDAIFYWPRLWIVLDKDLREEVDGLQAVADSTVYVTFSLYLSGIVGAVYGVIKHTERSHWYQASSLPTDHLSGLPGPVALYVLALTCFIAGYLLYRAALPLHAQFGELFKASFDQFRGKLQFDDVLSTISDTAGIEGLKNRTTQEKNRIVWRYLRWHRIRDEASGKNLTVGEWRQRQSPATLSVMGDHDESIGG